MTPDEWAYDGYTDYNRLPLQPKLRAHLCYAYGTVEGIPWMCSRAHRHTGRHAAGDGQRIVAVWAS